MTKDDFCNGNYLLINTKLARPHATAFENYLNDSGVLDDISKQLIDFMSDDMVKLFAEQEYDIEFVSEDDVDDLW